MCSMRPPVGTISGRRPVEAREYHPAMFSRLDRRRSWPVRRRFEPARSRRLPPPLEEAIDLQQSAGNRAVTSLLLQRAPDPPTPGQPAAVAQAPDLAWIDALPGFVTAQIDAFSQDYFDKQPPARQQKLLEKRDQNRNTFVVNMRPYLGSDAAIEAHFKDVAPISGTDLWAHGSTRERLLEVKADVESRGSPMPRTGVGQALRGRHLHAAGKDPGAGMMTHALGFAVDWKAYAAPHVKDPRLHALFEAVTDEKPAMHLKLGAKALGWTARHDLIEQLGKGTADPERERLLMASIESEYARLKKASDDFKVSLPEASLAQLRAVEDARNVVTAAEGKVARVRKKRGRTPAELQAAVAALADARAAFESAKQTTKPQLKTIFDPWLKRIGSRIDAINAAARAKGVDLESEVTSEATLKDLRGKVKALDARERPHERVAKAALADVRRIEQDLRRIAARVRAAEAWLARPTGARPPSAADSEAWARDLKDVGAAAATGLEQLGPLKTELGSLLPGAKVDVPAVAPVAARRPSTRDIAAWRRAVDATPGRVEAASKKLVPVREPLASLVAQERSTAADLAARIEHNQGVATRLGAAGLKALQDEKVRLFLLQRTGEALVGDVDFVFKERDVADPGVTQLLGMMAGTQGGGFFTPDPETGGEAVAKKGEWSGSQGYNLTFFKAMVRHGFELGVAWEQSPDTMHFELVEGRRLAESGGTRAMTAGSKPAVNPP